MTRRLRRPEHAKHDGRVRGEHDPHDVHDSDTCRNRSALVITETELKLMAAAAIMGLRSRQNHGYNAPAAIGTPTAL
jgi:hypothetical protein